MKISCEKSDLLTGLNIALRAVPSKTPYSILESFLIDASDGIKIIASDNEMIIETMVTGKIEEPGKIAVDARLFGEIVRKLPENVITINTNEKFKVLIRCEDIEMILNGKDPDEFPSSPVPSEDNKVSISQFSLREIVRQTIFSISGNDANSIMRGELFEIQGDVLKVITLDTHRISIRNTKLSVQYGTIKKIIPGKCLLEVSRIISGNVDENVDIIFDENFVKFVFDDTIVISRLIEGEFFDVEKMISMDYETEVRINKNLLSNCVERALTLVREGEKRPVILNIGDEVMSIGMKSSLGELNEQIVLEKKEGKDQLVGFNPRFILDALKVIDDEVINIYFLNANAPCFIRNKDGEYVYIILPININR